ncbi:MAG TPA: site-specific integrase [Acidimicrobiales bacterium]|nr:site-specific integrase [Acidimicrobiales bacterium]
MPARRHFGSIRKLPSGRYQASYWHNVTRHVAPDTFLSKGDAQLWLSNVETSIHKGEWVDPAGGRMTVEELADRWKKHDPSKRKSTKARDDAILRHHILPTLRTCRLRVVTPPDIQRLVNRWAENNAPRTVDRQYDVLRAIFTYAVRCDWIARNPCRDIKVPSITTTRKKALTIEDIAAIAEAIDPRYQCMVWIGAVLGLRWAEVAGLTVGSLDLLRNTVTVTHQLGRDRELGEPKSQAGQRQLSIPKELSATLAAHMAANQLTGAEPDRLVFTTRQGKPLDYSHWRARAWLPATDKAGVEGAGFHDLRRANATTLVAEGINVKTAQTRLGHTDPRTTLSVYAQAVPEADRAAAAALGKRFFGTSSEKRSKGATAR